jgi:hypothetical protein
MGQFEFAERGSPSAARFVALRADRDPRTMMRES